MQIKVIAVGSSKWDRFIRRWGISLLIDGDILFDTFGDPGVFLNNARKMNIDFSKVRHVVLSHDDWDHISGLWYMINTNKNLTVYICPNFKEEIKERIKSFGVDLFETRDFLKIKDDIFSTGQIQGKAEAEDIYEQALVIMNNKVSAIVTGCAHPGILHIVEKTKKQFGEDIHTVIGGLHLKDSKREQVRQVIAGLKAAGVVKITPMHCTGKWATQAIRQVFDRGFLPVKERDSIEL